MENIHVEPFPRSKLYSSNNRRLWRDCTFVQGRLAARRCDLYQIVMYWSIYIRGFRKICLREFNSFFHFFVSFDGGREDLDTTISWPSSPRQQNAIAWRFAGGLIRAQHCVAL